MKKLLFLLLLFSLSSFAQIREVNEDSEVKSEDGTMISYKYLKKFINDETGAVEYEGKRVNKLSNAVKFFKDNICLPIKANNPNITSVSQITKDNYKSVLNDEVISLINNANKSFKQRLTLKTEKITIVAAATSANATKDAPKGFTEEQVLACYGGKEPDNKLLAEARAKNLRFIIGRFIPGIVKLVREKKLTVDWEAKTNQSKRYVKINGLDFEATWSGKMIQGEFRCGQNAGVKDGKQGDASKNYLFQDDRSSADFTRAIRVGGMNNKSVTVTFDALTIPDRVEIYTVNAETMKREAVYTDKVFKGRLFDYRNPKKYFVNRYNHSKLEMPKNLSDGITKIQSDTERYGGKGFTRMAKGDQDVITGLWENLINTQTKLSNVDVDFAGQIKKEIPLRGTDISHIVLKVYSPFPGTAFTIQSTCSKK
jgi:hypothetical protein